METFSGQTDQPFDIHDSAQISGDARGPITVHHGGDLRLSGKWSGTLTVLPGGRARVSGTGSGDLAVASGGTVELSGRFSGTVTLNDGKILVPVGAHFGPLALRSDGSLGRPGGLVVIDDDTPRLQLFGTYTDVSFR